MFGKRSQAERGRLAPRRTIACLAAIGSASLLAAAPGAASGAETTRSSAAGKVAEARQLLGTRSTGSRAVARAASTRPAPGYRGRRTRFTAEQNVFLPSTIALRDLETPGKASATVPAFRGYGPDGHDDVWYIVTEAADYDVAKVLGVNFAPKLAFGADTDGSQEVTLRRGRLAFRGAVDFAPERFVSPGTGPSAFPPAEARPGAIADDEWSSLVVTPTGSVLNVAVVANRTGEHDRLLSIDRRRGAARLQLLDGWQGGDRFYYHFVTDSSDPTAAAIEAGVYAPRLGNLPSYGESNVFDRSALLGFSPNANGETGLDNPERQGLNSTIVDGGADPVNVFPLDPDNDRRYFNNYSPMWDAHVNVWTDAAIAAGERRAIRGFGDLRDLVERGLVTSFAGSPGPANGFVAGLNATGLIINCPVIAQPFERVDRDGDDATPFRP